MLKKGEKGREKEDSRRKEDRKEKYSSGSGRDRMKSDRDRDRDGRHDYDDNDEERVPSYARKDDEFIERDAKYKVCSFRSHFVNNTQICI